MVWTSLGISMKLTDVELVSTGMDRWENHLDMQQATQANSASYHKRDREWVSAKVWQHSTAEEYMHVGHITLVDKRVGGR